MEILKALEKLNKKSGEPQAFTFLRSEGAKALTNLGWPTKKVEAWKYSPVQRFQQSYAPQVGPQIYCAVEPSHLIKDFSKKSFLPLITFNGKILSIHPDLTQHIILKPLREAFEKGLLDSNWFSSIVHPLEALNLSYLDQGYYLEFSKNLNLDQPIHWIQAFSSNDINPLFQSQVFVKLGTNSSVSMIQSQVNLGDFERSWSNCSSTYIVENNSKLQLAQLFETEETHQQTDRTKIILSNQSELHHLQISLSAGWTRNEVSIECTGSQNKVTTHSIGFSEKASIVDQQTHLKFFKPENQSEQIAKNLLTDQSRAIFNGQIFIDKEAQKTDSSQIHRSLIIGSEAEVDTKPQLEIYADDVKATHGATIGSLNSDEIFYLQSRGIPQERATEILCGAFLLDLCDHFPNSEIQYFLKAHIEKSIKGEKHR